MPKRPDLVAFARRDWEELARSKASFWEEVRRSQGLDAVFAAVESLRALAAEGHPGWPDAADRQEDLRTHRRVAEALARAGLARRP